MFAPHADGFVFQDQRHVGEQGDRAFESCFQQRRRSTRRAAQCRDDDIRVQNQSHGCILTSPAMSDK